MTPAEQEMLSYIRHYPEWWAIVQSEADSRQAIRYDLDKIQCSPNGDGVFNLAMQINDCETRILKVEHCLWDVGRVNTRVDLLRDVFCYGELGLMKAAMYYKWRKRLVKRLMMEEWDEEETD